MIGKAPGDYSSKLRIQLSPEMPANQAVRKIFKFLLDVMKQNEPGIKKDIDTEFLHDYRVAIRRTRSALSQIKNVFPAEITNRFKKDFSYLGKFSNTLRDLDVYLLKEDQYKAMLPPELQADIDPLFKQLKKERIHEHKKFVKSLNSKLYKEIINDWQEFLNEPDQSDSSIKNAELPIINLAKDVIYKKYKQVIATGKRINNETPEELLHALRIDCKKLRYLLEFFISLFPASEMNYLIKQLKKLQDNLGDFNDLSIQQKALKELLKHLPKDDSSTLKTAAAIGCLIGNLHHNQKQVRRCFSQIFTAFSKPEHAELFRRLFASSVS